MLLAGLGNTAHVFDDFAPKLTSGFHVYGITRRGFGASTTPTPVEAHYSADRLGDDVLAVLDAMKIQRPILIGHSIAGEELSSVGTRHPERVAGLVYLDAIQPYAYYNRSAGSINISIDSNTLQRALEAFQKGPSKVVVEEMLNEDLPAFESDLHEAQKLLANPPPVPTSPVVATDADKKTFDTFGAWWASMRGFSMPESELRHLFESTPDGRVGKPRNDFAIRQAILAGEQKYRDIRVPGLALVAMPPDDARWMETAGVEVAAFESGVPSVRVVRLPRADHYVFLSNEADVLREVRLFLASLD